MKILRVGDIVVYRTGMTEIKMDPRNLTSFSLPIAPLLILSELSSTAGRPVATWSCDCSLQPVEKGALILDMLSICPVQIISLDQTFGIYHLNSYSYILLFFFSFLVFSF